MITIKSKAILFNLLSNAFKFTPNGGKGHSVSLQATPAGNGQNRTGSSKVSDTGIGLMPIKKEQIFERFFQSDLPPDLHCEPGKRGYRSLYYQRVCKASRGRNSGEKVSRTKAVLLLFPFYFQRNLLRQPLKRSRPEPEFTTEHHSPPEKFSEPGFSWRSQKPILMLIEEQWIRFPFLPER